MTAFVSAESIQLRPTQSLADNVSFLESLERELSVSDKPGDRRLQLNVRCDSTVRADKGLIVHFVIQALKLA